MLVSQIYLNVVIAVIVDAFGGTTSVSKLPFSDILVDDFLRSWAKYDQEASYFITIENLLSLLEDLSRQKVSGDLFIYQHAVESSKDFRLRLIRALEIPMFGKFKKVMFYDVL